MGETKVDRTDFVSCPRFTLLSPLFSCRVAHMRSSAFVLCLAIFAPLTGCENGGKRFMFGPRSADPPSAVGLQSSEALVDYLNDNAANMQSLRCVDIDGLIQGYGFKGKMMAMKPRNFLMTATVLRSTIVDLGSNENEFWFWSSKAPEPHQYYCSYKDFESGKVSHFPFPFQPDWIMESFGMGPYGPPSKYTVEPDGRTGVKLVERTRTPQGVAVRKVIVMSRKQEYSPTPQVRAHQLLDDATGKEICSAQIQETKNIRGVVVPVRVEFRVPDQNMNLKLTFNGMTLNELRADSDLAVFQRHPMQGVSSIDLARGPTGGTGR